MSTNKSEHLKLHLWEPEDDFLRTEFNENFEAIDEASRLRPYKTGSYTGNGNRQTITLGFRPSFLIISGQGTGTNTASVAATRYFALTGGNRLPDMIQFQEEGFQVNAISLYYPYLNEANCVYDFIAFQ